MNLLKSSGVEMNVNAKGGESTIPYEIEVKTAPELGSG